MCVCVRVQIHKITKRPNLKATKERHKGMFRGRMGKMMLIIASKQREKTRER